MVARWLITRNRLRANNQDQDLTVGIKQSQRNVNIDYKYNAPFNLGDYFNYRFGIFRLTTG
ncbi:MAG UNVERIFIED_CONTAM: hypothetical protein LVR29_08675 [Microcystis novacekii LVE1205-3]